MVLTQARAHRPPTQQASRPFVRKGGPKDPSPGRLGLVTCTDLRAAAPTPTAAQTASQLQHDLLVRGPRP